MFFQEEGAGWISACPWVFSSSQTSAPLLPLSALLHSTGFVSPLQRTCLCMWKLFRATVLLSLLPCFSFLYWSVLVSSLWCLLFLILYPLPVFLYLSSFPGLEINSEFFLFLTHMVSLVFTSDLFKNIPGSWTFSLLVHEPGIFLHLFKSSLVFICLFIFNPDPSSESAES